MHEEADRLVSELARAAAKAGIICLIKALALGNAAHGITNAVAPGYTNTTYCACRSRQGDGNDTCLRAGASPR